jgi:hypothetical protein
MSPIMLCRSIPFLIILLLCGCQPDLYDPARATRAYPFELHQPASVDIQLFRDGEHITLYNATASTYSDFDLWLNQRYVAHVDSLPAGGNITLPLWDFWDERGEVINAGGFFRVDEPTPIRLAEIQTAEDQPLVGLVTIRAESVE